MESSRFKAHIPREQTVVFKGYQMFLDPPADRESDSALAEPLSGSTVADVLDLQTTLISDIAQVRRPQLMSVTVTASSLDCHCYRSGNPPAVDVRNLRPSEQELHTHTHTRTHTERACLSQLLKLSAAGKRPRRTLRWSLPTRSRALPTITCALLVPGFAVALRVLQSDRAKMQRSLVAGNPTGYLAKAT